MDTLKDMQLLGWPGFDSLPVAVASAISEFLLVVPHIEFCYRSENSSQDLWDWNDLANKDNKALTLCKYSIEK